MGGRRVGLNFKGCCVGLFGGTGNIGLVGKREPSIAI